MGHDDMVELTVRMPKGDVRLYGAFHDQAQGELDALVRTAAREWVAANEPVRRVYWLRPTAPVGTTVETSPAVAVEDLRPGDRVAGREVTYVENDRPSVGVFVGYGDEGRTYPAGTLVVLDTEGDR